MDRKFRVNLPPDPNPRRPRFTPPKGTCDTHFHVFGPPHLFPFVEQRIYTPPAAPIEHFLMMADIVGIDRGILVVPNVHGFENDVLFDAMEKSDGRLRGMIRANPDLSAADYRALHDKGVRGIRFNFARHLNGTVDTDNFHAIVDRVAPLGWPVDLHIDADLIVEYADLIRQTPAPIVIDHFGRIDGAAGVDQPAFQALLDLLGEDHVWVKISGADRLVQRGAAYEDAAPFAHALISRAPDRIIWGTDWPHSNYYQSGNIPNDGMLMDLMADYAPDEATRNRILADNPARLFWFD
jgi:predicted TIM-barrel fold metal-dependent hydrolase